MSRNEYDHEATFDLVDEMTDEQEEFLLNKFGIDDDSGFERIERRRPQEEGKAQRSPRQNRKDKKFRELRQTMRKI